MERILSDEDKIRKAIEISQRRNNYYSTYRIKKEDNEKKKGYKLFKKMFLQIFICMFIYGIFYLISNTNYFFSDNILTYTKEILNKDINFNLFIENSKNKINLLIDKYKKQNIVEKNEDDTNIVSDNSNENITNEILEKTENIAQFNSEKENNEKDNKDENLSQMEKDVKYIKENYNFIKPISGKITSKFGDREVLISGMTSNHKGIDIAAKQGTKIKAAIQGQVYQVGYNSQYGNFIKIKNNDLITVYAHCKKLKVSKGDTIKKGDVIATVGSTGIATGPHLHFEIRLNNRYINPKLIIQF